MKFKELNLDKSLVDSLQRQGYVNMTKVQENIIPLALKNKSLIVKAMTGSGKTHAFLVPIIQRMDFSNSSLEAIIIVPTRELGYQTLNFIKGFKEDYPSLNVNLAIGGEKEKENKAKILIATPSKFLKLYPRIKGQLTNIKTLVLDEMDMLFDLGFYEDVDKIIKLFPDVQTLVFSATIMRQLRTLFKKYLKADAVKIIDETSANVKIEHYLIDIRHQDITKCVMKFIDIVHPYMLLIFANTITKVDNLYKQLVENKYIVGRMHGSLEPRERKNTLKDTKEHKYPVVIMSDVGSRGIDISDVTHILNIDFPSDMAYYFHRVGRTARHLECGKAYTFVNRDEDEKEILALSEKGIHFQTLRFKDDDLMETKPFIFKDKKETVELSRDIKKAISKTKGNKVKPGYKKKMKLAVEKVKRRHRFVEKRKARNEIKNAR